MNLELLEKTNWIIYKTITGSNAYGTNTPLSDLDYRGIFIVPAKERITLKQPLTEIGQEKPEDIKYYELGKFMVLAQDCNPNIIELLYMPEDCIKIKTPVMQRIIDNRHLFISKKAFHTFSGYAVSQIKKCRGENKWINNPKGKEPPKREDFCWVIPKEDFDLDSNTFRIGLDLPPARPTPILHMDINLAEFHASSLEHMSNTYRLYYYGKEARGVFRNNNLAVESIPLHDEAVKF